jgi:hypothetical protein
MPKWYLVFGRADTEVQLAELLAYLNSHGVNATGQVSSDEGGGVVATVLVAPGRAVELKRYQSSEEGIREELTSWAAFLETCEANSHAIGLMEHMIQTRQLFTLRVAPGGEDKAVEQVCVGMCKYLARATDGVYQVDNEGFYSAEGELLVWED